MKAIIKKICQKEFIHYKINLNKFQEKYELKKKSGQFQKDLQSNVKSLKVDKNCKHKIKRIKNTKRNQTLITI